MLHINDFPLENIQILRAMLRIIVVKPEIRTPPIMSERTL